MKVTRQQIAEDLARLGMQQGTVVAVHSSLKSLGSVEGGPDALIDAVLDVVGPGGTLVVPAFTYCFRGYADAGIFDQDESPARTGLVAETLRLRKGAIRSFHPTHSVSALGSLAGEITRGHLQATPLGRNSPFHKLALHAGWILLIGCGHDSNSFIHTAEVLAGLTYVRVFCWLHRQWEPEALFVDESGQIRTLAIYECPGCSKGFPRIEGPVRSQGRLREGRVGQARAQLVRAADLLLTVQELVRADPAFLLCPQGTCPACDVRRIAIRLPTPPPVPSPETWVVGQVGPVRQVRPV
jgi:aminoglycoside 3-N-acetyltransferase